MARPRIAVGTYGSPNYVTLPSGRIQVEVRLRAVDGRIRKVKSTGRSKAEALRRLKVKLSELTIAPAKTSTALTADSLFPDLVDAWLQSLDDVGRLAASTRYTYEKDIRNLVLPAFQHFALREITVRKVDELLKNLRKLSYNRARKAKTVLRLAFGLAVRWEVLDRNPVHGVEQLHRPPRQAKALAVDTIEDLRAALTQFQVGREGKPGPKPDPQIPVIIEVMLGTSARIGEVLALRRMDVELESGLPTVRIAGTVIQVGRGPVHRQGHPKTAKSNRTVTIPRFAADALATHLSRLGPIEPDALIFSTRRGTPMSTNNFRRALATQLKGSEVGHVTPHAFRRTVATTIDRARGIQLAAELLGHTNTEITRIHYIEPNVIVNPTTADILEAALGNSSHPVIEEIELG